MWILLLRWKMDYSPRLSKGQAVNMHQVQANFARSVRSLSIPSFSFVLFIILLFISLIVFIQVIVFILKAKLSFFLLWSGFCGGIAEFRNDFGRSFHEDIVLFVSLTLSYNLSWKKVFGVIPCGRIMGKTRDLQTVIRLIVDSKGNRLSNPYSTCLAWRCNGELTKKGVSTP